MKQSFSRLHNPHQRSELPYQFILSSRILSAIPNRNQGSASVRSIQPGDNDQMQSNATTVPTLICLAAGLVFFGGCRSNMGQNGFGVSLFQQGRYSEALQQFELAKQADPSNPDVYYNLASTYHRLGVNAKDAKMIETSEALYNQCLDLSPNHVDCHRGLAVLLVDSGRSEKAFSLLKNWTQRTPNLSDSRVELARLHQEFNQTKASEQYLDEALAMDPRNAKAWAATGKLRESSGELMQAVQNYQQSLAINNSQPDLFQRISALNVRIAQASSGAPGGPNVIAGNPGAPGANPPSSNEPKRY